MKKLKLALTILCLVLCHILEAQILNQTADWGVGTSWALSGTYDPTALINDPTQTSNFGYDDDADGDGYLFPSI